MAERKLYKGGCQCGAVTFEAELALEGVVACNCSRCRRLGSLLAFAPADQFRLLSGADRLTDFQFNKHVIHHLFCQTCGIEPFARGTPPGGKSEMFAINVRCLDDVDIASLPVKHFDGASL
jgi:hypothetical protein